MSNAPATTLGAPLTAGVARAQLSCSGEMGKQVTLELQRLGAELFIRGDNVERHFPVRTCD